MSNHLVNEQQFYQKNFDIKTMARGRVYYQQQRVVDLNIYSEGRRICSRVQGSGDSYYNTEIVLLEESDSEVLVRGHCSCFVGFNCKHVFATLLKAEEKPPLQQTLSVEEAAVGNEKSPAVDAWLNSFQRIDEKERKSNKGREATYHVLYVLEPVSSRDKGRYFEVSLYCARCLLKGGYGKPSKFNFDSRTHQNYLQEKDQDIVAGLRFLEWKGERDYFSSLSLFGAKGDEVLMELLKTGRAYWQKPLGKKLALGEQKVLDYHWKLLESGNQKLEMVVDNQAITVLTIGHAWYLDEKSFVCGALSTNLSTQLLSWLVGIPEVPPNHIAEIQKKLKKAVPDQPKLLPEKVKVVSKMMAAPTPQLRLDRQKVSLKSSFVGSRLVESIEMSTAQVSFNYDGVIVPFSLANRNATVTYCEQGVVYSFKRDFEAEKENIQYLVENLELEQLDEEAHRDQATTLLIKSPDTEEAYLSLVLETLPDFEQKGWHIIRDHQKFAEVVFDEDLDWYSELDEKSSYDYFGFNLGIVVDGEKVDILPIIAKVIREIDPKTLAKIPDQQTLPLPLPNGKILALPYARIKPILHILVELYSNELSDSNALKLSANQASLLYEIEQAFKASKMRWFGGEKLRKLGQKLADFSSIKAVKLPSLFKGSLRSYQQEGVNWLQFLREYQLNGILADDMGLGKTVQALAHLAIEKQKKRMVKPSLIIAPTSLMANWAMEAVKFAPSLKILTYHGHSRKSDSDCFGDYDIILTTYPLLFRDKKILLAYEFYYLILDEAQYIKNHKAKSTQITHQLQAEHRLCLTGTPMENHLTELWSLFHFLMPGLLGEALPFKKLFRTPIEKHHDRERQQALSRRIKPFLLRRKKEEVVQELPEKTVIIQTVELQDEQRDLYESIRLAMEQKVQQALQQKGLSRSHIVILDAILKLRQICCHPQLLKIPSLNVKKLTSAKLNLLMEMVPSMVEEGRRILIFSQFTTMLKLIEEQLQQADISYSKLTGATVNRKKAIESFQSGEVPVFLISLKAGGTGLNLTAADTVIHYDPWWNPSVEDQATDRAHRIGQEKAVFVYKLLTVGTIEETIYEMQQRKRQLIEGLLSEQSLGQLSLSAEDLQHLFKPI